MVYFSFWLTALPSINIHQGIHVVHSSCPGVTHNLVQELTATPSCVSSLLNSRVVTPRWLMEVIRRGTEGNRGSLMEQHFELPDTSSYLPAVSAALSSTLSSTDFWTNSASRLGILDGYRFIILIRDSENVEDFQSVVSSSGGGYELFPVGSGKARLHRRLSADKDKRIKIVVVDDEVKASVTPDSWNELIDETKASVPPHPLSFFPLNTFKVRVEVLQPGTGSRNYCRWEALRSGPPSGFVPISCQYCSSHGFIWTRNSIRSS